MSRPKVKHTPKNKPQVKSESPAQLREPLELEKKDLLFPLPGFLVQAILIALIALGFYYNSTSNEYALDDGIVIVENEFVQQGAGGISDIMTKDAFHSYYSKMGAKQELKGGRYRPLSIVTFAMEQQVFGKDTDPKTPVVLEEERTLTWVRHFVNVLLYAFSGVLLLYLLSKYIFRSNTDIAFLATLIFVIHPIHTEAVANTKSRDEIMSFLFITLTLISLLRYHESPLKKHLVWSLAFFFLALLSKEYAITLLALVPILLYVHKKYDWTNAFKSTGPYFGVALLYILIRVGSVGLGKGEASQEVLNNPYLYASSAEKLATKIYMPWNYLRLLFWPDPLSSDYSYNHYPYRKLGDPMVWASLLIHGGMLITGFVLLARRHILAFAIFFYLLHLALVANFVMDIGATMGERLIYHSSLGFTMVIAYIVINGFDRLKAALIAKRVVLGLATVAIVVLCGYKVIERNPDWKNDYTLFTKDVNTVPNSVLANGNAGAQYINSAFLPENRKDSALAKPGEVSPTQRKLIEKGIGYLQHAVTIHPKYVNGHLNMGLGYFRLNQYDKAGQSWVMAHKYFPSNIYLKNYSQLMMSKAFQYGAEKKFNEAIMVMEYASQMQPNDPEIWYNLGGAYYSVQEFTKAKEAWTRCLQMKPDHAQAKQGMAAIPPGTP